MVEDESGLHGIDAVIDKDKSCCRLAIEMKADILLILTAVDQVCINFNRPEQRALDRLSLGEAKEYIKQGQFARGSMLPKVEACVEFAEALPGRTAIITSLEKARQAIEGAGGTLIRSEAQIPVALPKRPDENVLTVAI